MRFALLLLVSITLLSCSLLLPLGMAAQAAPPAEVAIRALLEKQVADWNRGDLDAFAAGYKNSPDILFIGRAVRHGYGGMLEGYRRSYPTRGTMGILSFSALEMQPLDASFSTATGHYHLARSSAAGGDADGFFMLVLEKTPAGWRIVRDDTTALPSAGATAAKP